MTYTGHENQSITLADAVIITKAFRDSVATNPNAIIAEYFGCDTIKNILAQPGCVGIRIYNGLDTSNVQTSVIVGVDTYGNDLFNGILADRSLKCPINCASSNPLNS